MFENICLDLFHPYQVATMLETMIILLKHYCFLLGLFVHTEIQLQTAKFHISKLPEAFDFFYLLASVGREVVMLFLEYAAAVVVINAFSTGALV